MKVSTNLENLFLLDYALSASIMRQQLDLLASSYERKCSIFQYGNGSHSLYALPWLTRKTCSQRGLILSLLFPPIVLNTYPVVDRRVS
jgi:hypothetical protein